MLRLAHLLLVLLLTGSVLAPDVLAHGGEDHGGSAAAPASGDDVITTSVLTRRYEIVLKHGPVRGGQPFAGTLYLAFFETNLPVRGAKVTVEEPGATGKPFVVRETATPGVYAVTRPAGFVRDGRYSLTVRVTGPAGADLALLSGVYIGPVQAAPGSENSDPGASSTGLPWIWIVLVAVLGVGFALWLARIARHRRVREREEADAPPPPPVPSAAPARTPRPVVREPTAP